MFCVFSIVMTKPIIVIILLQAKFFNEQDIEGMSLKFLKDKVKEKLIP